jgi:methyltransferase-like protein
MALALARSNNYQYNIQGFMKKKKQKKKGKIHFTLSKVNHFFTFVSNVLKVAIYPNKVSKFFNITTLLIICLLYYKLLKRPKWPYFLKKNKRVVVVTSI